jgi:hypothetical protein
MTKSWTIPGILVCLLSLYIHTACKSYNRDQPLPPAHVRGWVEENKGGVHSLAEILLKEGESSENGTLGVTVISISRELKSVGVFDHPPPPEATLRFYRVSDKEPLQDVTVWTGGRAVNKPPLPGPDFGIHFIYVNQINTRDRWIWFDLRRLDQN